MTGVSQLSTGFTTGNLRLTDPDPTVHVPRWKGLIPRPGIGSNETRERSHLRIPQEEVPKHTEILNILVRLRNGQED